MSEPHYTIHPDVLAQDVDGELVLLHLGTEDYYGLNEVGARIWEQIREHGSLARTIDAIASRYGVDRVRVEQDATALLGDLVARQIVRASADRPGITPDS